MSLESASFASQLNELNPAGTDPRSQGDDHIRTVKAVVKNELSPANRQWVYTGHVVEWASGKSFTMDDDQTTVYEAERRLKITGSNTGTVYGSVSSSTYSSAMTVNIRFDATSSMSNEALIPYVGLLTKTNPVVPTLLLPYVAYTTSHTLLKSEANGFVQGNVAGLTFTTPASTFPDVPDGALWNISNGLTGGTITVAPGAGVTLYWLKGDGTTNTGSRTLAALSICFVYRVTAAAYYIWGTGVT